MKFPKINIRYDISEELAHTFQSKLASLVDNDSFNNCFVLIKSNWEVLERRYKSSGNVITGDVDFLLMNYLYTRDKSRLEEFIKFLSKVKGKVGLFRKFDSEHNILLNLINLGKADFLDFVLEYCKKNNISDQFLVSVYHEFCTLFRTYEEQIFGLKLLIKLLDNTPTSAYKNMVNVIIKKRHMLDHRNLYIFARLLEHMLKKRNKKMRNDIIDIIMHCDIFVHKSLLGEIDPKYLVKI
jgi:hypothetical protein